MKCHRGMCSCLDFILVFLLFVFRLKDASLSLLEKYGSQLIKSVKYRDSFVMLGQKGLSRGKAIELVRKYKYE